MKDLKRPRGGTEEGEQNLFTYRNCLRAPVKNDALDNIDSVSDLNRIRMIRYSFRA